MYSGNIVTENGDSFIPASQRPDGTWRKARRVKEGYVPQEEVPLYESKGKQFVKQSKPSGPIKLSSGQTATAHSSIPGLFILDDKEKEKKNAKKKNKTKVEEVSKQLQEVKINKESKPKTTEQPKAVKTSKDSATKTVEPAKADQAADPAKKLKNLRKKLREIESLEEKIKNNEIVKPEPEQLTKIKRKNELLMEIRQLEKQM